MSDAWLRNQDLTPAQRRLAGVLPAPTVSPWEAGPAAPVAPVEPEVVGRPGGRERAASEDGEDGESGAPAQTSPESLATRLGGGVFDPGRRGLRALAVVLLLVAVGAAGVTWWSRPRPEPVAPVLTSTTEASPTAPATLVVAVAGDVHTPGLVELTPGARVADAIDAAGGVLPDAEVDQLNLARPLTDGELVAVGVPPVADGQAGGPAEAGPPGSPVNLNTASAAELQALPGIGPALADRIIAHRADHGPFATVEELREVSGIGESRLADLRDRVTV